MYIMILKKFKANAKILFLNKTFYFNGFDNYDGRTPQFLQFKIEKIYQGDSK